MAATPADRLTMCHRINRQESQWIVEQERHDVLYAESKRIDPGCSMRNTQLIGLLTERLSSIYLDTHIDSLFGQRERDQPGRNKQKSVAGERERRGPCLATI